MIIDIIDKLIERCIQLIKNRQEIDRNLFTNFIEPVYIGFEVIHKEYLSSFRKYREHLKNQHGSLDSVIDMVKEDKLFNEGHRRKLYELSTVYDDKKIGPFIYYILGYLLYPYEFVPEEDDDNDEEQKQRWFSTFIGVLEIINKPPEELRAREREWLQSEPFVKLNKGEKAIRTLDNLVGKMQEIYGLVTHEYLKLKKELLTKYE